MCICVELISVTFTCTNSYNVPGDIWKLPYIQYKRHRGASLTEGGAGFGPRHRRNDDEPESLVLAAADFHIVGLQGRGGDGDDGVWRLRRGCDSRYRNHGVGATTRASAPSSTAADTGGGAAAGADRVEGVLAALRSSLPDLLRQAGCLGAAVMGGCG